METIYQIIQKTSYIYSKKIKKKNIYYILKSVMKALKHTPLSGKK